MVPGPIRYQHATCEFVQRCVWCGGVVWSITDDAVVTLLPRDADRLRTYAEIKRRDTPHPSVQGGTIGA